MLQQLALMFFLVLPVCQPKMWIRMHNLVDHMKAKHKVTQKSRCTLCSLPSLLLKRADTFPVLGTEDQGPIASGCVSCCVSWGMLISVFSSSDTRIYERALHRWVRGFYPHFLAVQRSCIRRSNYFYQQDCDSHHILWKFSSLKL